MPPPSYPHRHLLLTELLAAEPAPPEDAFAVSGAAPNLRGCKLDALLLAGWSAPRRTVDHDVLQHADNLRLKRNDFDILGRIGEGQFGVVDAVRSKLDGKVYAMKTIEKSMAQRAGSQLGLAYERHLHSLAGPGANIPALATSFQSPSALHLVTAYASCGSLWDRLCEALPSPGLDTGRMGEVEVGWWAKQMVSAIAWVHDNGYAHRDIKPHNFLLHGDGRLWLTDFGSAAPLTSGFVPRRHCLLPAGTPDYVAPEVLRLAEDAMIEAAQSVDESMDRTLQQVDLDAAGYMPDVDWWSLGATLYEMAVGRAPFWAPSIGATYERVIKCDLRMPEHLSPQLKSLLSGLLSPHDVRLSNVADIRSHSFFTSDSRSPPSISPQPIDLETLAESFVHDFDNGEFTFDHLFNASTISAMTSISVAPPPSVWSKWVGWSLDPPPDFFGDEPPSSSPVRPLPALFTPLRRPLPATTRTAPRSVPRTRPVSERRAFAELIQCVEASARKKLARSNPPPNSASTASTSGSPWQKEQPPTPTPMSREVSALGRRPLSRTSSRAGSEEVGSRNSQRRDDTLLARLAAVSDALPDEPRFGHGRTRSLELKFGHNRTRSKDDTFLLRLAERSRSRTESREDTPLARFSVRKPPLEVRSEVGECGVAEVGGHEGHSRLEVEVGMEREAEVEMEREREVEKEVENQRVEREEWREAKISQDSRHEADARLARLVGMGDDGPLPTVQVQEPSLYEQAQWHSGRNSHYELKPEPVKYSSLEAWHVALESGVSSLERRLADMTARLGVAI